MTDFTDWGIKTKKFTEYNYHSIWHNLKTIRLGRGVAKELPPHQSEFYDVSLGTKCNLECPFCYVDAKRTGRFYTDITEKAKFFFGGMSDNDKPFQIAIGSEGEPTIHPDFIDFIKAVHDLKIVPNYTTNGLSIANNDQYSIDLLKATEKYCGGVALSANNYNSHVERQWQTALRKLSEIDIHINIHYIISDAESIKSFEYYYNKYHHLVKYFVLLPLMPSGRSERQCNTEVFKQLITKDFEWEKIAFGAHFYNELQNQDKIKCWLYPPESLSKNLILDDPIRITASSFSKESLMDIKFSQKD